MLVTHPSATPPACQQAVVALGNFDGVHKGHQIVLETTRMAAREKGRPFGVVTFEPHPRRVFFPDHPPFRLTPAPVKRRLLEDLGVDVLFEIPFDTAFASHSAAFFMEDILQKGLAISHAVAGHDFVFGHKRTGTMALLKQTLEGKGLGVTEVAPVCDEAQLLWSSTRIRAQLEEGNVEGAALALGRAFEIEGVVEEGDKRGRTLGFPTANIGLGDFLRPRFGVYAVEIQVGDVWLRGAANIGTRPTVDGAVARLEVHLFDFSGDLYGQNLRVAMRHFLRPERPFASLEALKTQIAEDCRAACRLLETGA